MIVSERNPRQATFAPLLGRHQMRITPRNDRFYQMFSAAADNAREATAVLVRLLAEPRERRAGLARRLKELEHRGDELTHEIMGALNTSFITPFDREDIAFLAGRLDDVVDDIEAAGDLTVLYRIDDLPAEAQQQAALLDEAAQITAAAMPRLKTLQKLEDYWISINEVENRADTVYRTLLAELFDRGGDVLTLIKTKEIVDQLESAADAFERVANVVQSIAAKET
jgi:predicted phosphate transport protein (TIGR00153 family)